MHESFECARDVQIIRTFDVLWMTFDCHVPVERTIDVNWTSLNVLDIWSFVVHPMDICGSLGRCICVLSLSPQRQRAFIDWTNPLYVFGEELKRFRVARNGIALHADLVRQELESRTQRSMAVPVILQVVVVLQVFPTRNFLVMAGDLDEVHEPTASRIVRRVALALKKRTSQFIR